ncbi:MAG: acetyl-CoA carboxylase biotin carboxyl carrier protein [Lentisphaerae bacterium]|nr:acetyl-CoA carboxylase biotin carboxyl carrier protein [Lentisphaerota bacterium]
MKIEIEEIRSLVSMMGEYNLSEIKIEDDGCNICLRRNCATEVPVAPVAIQTVAAAPAAPAVQAAPAPAAPAVEAARITIDSPLVGTLYRAPGPDAQPFVQVGDRVNPDTTICIIEAMKVMNEVKAEKSGVIKEILVENAQAVEYGQPIFVIE